MSVRMRPAEHVSLAASFPLENAPRTSCYGHVLQPTQLDVTLCQHPGEPWGVVCVELIGLLVHHGATTGQPATARWDLDETDSESVPVWITPLVDQVQADMDRRERMAVGS